MKRKLIVLALSSCFLLSGCNNALPASAWAMGVSASPSIAIEERENPNFRSAIWGDNKDTIKALEPDLKWEVEKEDMLIGETKTLDRDTDIVFMFENGKLYQGIIAFTDTHTSENLYIKDFENIKKSLIEKYGEPDEDGQQWISSEYKNRPSKYGKAVANGSMKYSTVWRNEHTQILLSLVGDNGNIALGITYLDMGYEYTINTDGI